MAKLDLDWLAVFVEVYKTQSVSRAAERLGMAQASASIALNKLRRHFDDPLFSRTSRGMEPTPRARSIHPEIVEALQRLERARGAPEAFAASAATREFRIGMTDISEVVLLPTLANHLQRHAPGLTVEAEKMSVESRRRLEAGEIDLAVGFAPNLEAGFYQQALFEQSFVCLASADHPRVQSAIDRQAFVAESHIVVTTSGTGHTIVDKLLARERLERRVVLRVPSFLGVARIVARTELLVIVPRLLGETLASQERIQVLEPPLRLPAYKVKQHWHERFNADPGNRWLRRTMAELFSGVQAHAGAGAEGGGRGARSSV
ncbi:LysR family transcriptional regulator [Piscinibacter koreensis]|uniref:LysR family transcriptional regulator n=1 Tax=Piscinibacter koreensis TaxID=2742824 RepID=A0A7Y6NS54_9BURK|nr:LysR family transcriptional regulator [Schlegelella koreensis]NUZ08339.1 LysR family transcriptional regulator [Schlegelella koreensis]